MCDLCFVPRCDCESLTTGSSDALASPVESTAISVPNTPAPTPGDALGLDSTNHWTGSTVTYGFPATAAEFRNGVATYSAFNEPGSMLALSNFGRTTLRDGFAQWDALTALTITEAAPTVAQINVGASTVPGTAWAYYPGGQQVNGDVWFNTSKWYLDALSSPTEPVIGSYAYATGMHEFGHALGLKHPHQTSGGGNVIMPAAYDAVEFTIMSYRSYPGGPASAYTIETWGYPQSPMMLDIAMIQAIYGADYSTRSGDTTYTVSTTTGEFFIDGVSQGVPGANRVFRTIWDGDGTDHINLSNYTTSMYADLNPGRGIEFDTNGTFQAARLASGVYAGFNIYMSLLHDGNTRSLIENLTTGSGDDILIGNAADNVLTSTGGNNTFTGGLGADRLVLGSGVDTVIDTLAGLDGDTVVGFDAAKDRLLLQDITAAGLSASLAGGILTLTTGNVTAQVTLEGLDPALNTVTFVQDGTAVALTLSSDGTVPGPDTDEPATNEPDTDEPAITVEARLAEAIAAYGADGRPVIMASGSGGVNAPSGGAVLVGVENEFNRLREGAGDDVMYGGAGSDQFIWSIGRAGAERDTILDLDFDMGDVLRIIDASGSTFIKSHADLVDAVAGGLIGAAGTADGGTELWSMAAPDRVLELAFYDHFEFA